MELLTAKQAREIAEKANIDLLIEAEFNSVLEQIKKRAEGKKYNLTIPTTEYFDDFSEKLIEIGFKFCPYFVGSNMITISWD